MPFRVTHTDHLVALVAQAAWSAGRLVDLPESLRHAAVAAARRDAARLSARLDGSPLDAETAAAVDRGAWLRPPQPGAAERPGGWASALRLDGMETRDVAAVEYANLLEAYDHEAALADRLFDDPLRTLADLHGLICRGLVDPAVVGRLRTTEQAIHDGAQGRVIFNAADPAALPGLMTELADWLAATTAEGSAAYAAPVTAAVVHEVVLQWQPYEAANGRVARAAARLVLRARGLDPHGLVVGERQWAADAAAYHGEVAATIHRRGDLTTWVERHTEALVAALEDAVSSLRQPDAPPLPPRAVAAAEQLAPGQTVTVAQYAARWDTSRESAWRELRALAAAGAVVPEPRTLGRRFRRA